jgi:Tfp pilus assembly protein PilX
VREDGVALVLAVLVLAIVSMIAVSAIMYTSSSQQNAYSNKARHNAYSLAQAALSNATAQLTAQYYDSSGKPSNQQYAAPSGWLASGSQQSPSSSSSCTIGSTTTTCMHWTATPNTTGPFTGIQKAAWTLTGQGSVPNPSGSGAIVQTVSEVIPVTAPPMQVPAPDLYKGIYSGKGPTPGVCDLTTGQGVVWVSPVIVKGNLCIQQQSGVASPGTLNVGGFLQNVQGGAAGTSSAPLPSINVAGACNGTMASTPPCSPAWDSVHNYYADTSQNIYASALSNAPTFPSPPPSVDWSSVAADSGFVLSDPTGASDTWACTNGKSLRAATFDLTAGAPYTCTAPGNGKLAWDGTTLTINGGIYISGNLITQNNANVVYSGLGAIYVGGTITFGNNTAICVGSTGSHSCPSGYNWDATQDLIFLLSQGGIAGANLALEGGLYSDNNINFSSGQTQINGPIVTQQELMPGQQASSGFPNITTVLTSMPDTPKPYFLLGDPTNASF